VARKPSLLLAFEHKLEKKYFKKKIKKIEHININLHTKNDYTIPPFLNKCTNKKTEILLWGWGIDF
jgi:hypothetical protein